MNTAKRKDGESFAAHKQRRKAEALELKRKLAGRWFWVSCSRLLRPDEIAAGMTRGRGRTYQRGMR